jgi:hypothetical protein
MATPHVVGIVSLMLSVNPGLTPFNFPIFQNEEGRGNNC